MLDANTIDGSDSLCISDMTGCNDPGTIPTGGIFTSSPTEGTSTPVFTYGDPVGCDPEIDPTCDGTGADLPPVSTCVPLNNQGPLAPGETYCPGTINAGTPTGSGSGSGLGGFFTGLGNFVGGFTRALTGAPAPGTIPAGTRPGTTATSSGVLGSSSGLILIIAVGAIAILVLKKKG